MPNDDRLNINPSPHGPYYFEDLFPETGRFAEALTEAGEQILSSLSIGFNSEAQMSAGQVSHTGEIYFTIDGQLYYGLIRHAELVPAPMGISHLTHLNADIAELYLVDARHHLDKDLTTRIALIAQRQEVLQVKPQEAFTEMETERSPANTDEFEQMEIG